MLPTLLTRCSRLPSLISHPHFSRIPFLPKDFALSPRVPFPNPPLPHTSRTSSPLSPQSQSPSLSNPTRYFFSINSSIQKGETNPGRAPSRWFSDWLLNFFFWMDCKNSSSLMVNFVQFTSSGRLWSRTSVSYFVLIHRVLFLPFGDCREVRIVRCYIYFRLPKFGMSRPGKERLSLKARNCRGSLMVFSEILLVLGTERVAQLPFLHIEW